MVAALDGIKVVDLTRTLAGPFCTMMLGDMGAEVVRRQSDGTWRFIIDNPWGVD